MVIVLLSLLSSAGTFDGSWQLVRVEPTSGEVIDVRAFTAQQFKTCASSRLILQLKDDQVDFVAEQICSGPAEPDEPRQQAWQRCQVSVHVGRRVGATIEPHSAAKTTFEVTRVRVKTQGSTTHRDSVGKSCSASVQPDAMHGDLTKDGDGKLSLVTQAGRMHYERVELPTPLPTQPPPPKINK